MGDLVMDGAGNIYGTTSSGGSANSGTVFKLTPAAGKGPWIETVLYSFCAKDRKNVCLDGQEPQSALIFDAKGNLYGTTPSGGNKNAGIVFALSPSAGGGDWSETILHSFCSGPKCIDGRTPYAGLTLDGSGKLYGTTSAGGAAGAGAIFELSPGAAPGTWTQTVIYSFCTTAICPDGQAPSSSLIMDESGNLYGTTLSGGANCQPTATCGTVFKLSPDPAKAGSWTELVLHNFCAFRNCTDGKSPAGLVMDSAGDIFGTTKLGGSRTVGIGTGLVFELVND
jgi:uncharacterized repeat protein (TIGR03803 family)